VSLPAGALGVLLDPITKFLFLDSYRVSHNEHINRFQIGKRFDELGEFFEFDIHLECNYLSNSTVPMSFIILRNKSSREFSRIELLVEADAGYVKYQDFSVLKNVGDIPLAVNLPRIPLREVELTSNNRILMTYEKVQVELNIIDDSLEASRCFAKSRIISPSYTEFLNSSWDKKWDFVWNLDYIESKKRELRDKLYYYLAGRYKWPVFGEPKNVFFMVYKRFRFIVGVPLFKAVGNRRVLAILFWLPIFLRLKKLRPRESD
jgi:hypothetical protein